MFDVPTRATRPVTLGAVAALLMLGVTGCNDAQPIARTATAAPALSQPPTAPESPAFEAVDPDDPMAQQAMAFAQQVSRSVAAADTGPAANHIPYEPEPEPVQWIGRQEPQAVSANRSADPAVTLTPRPRARVYTPLAGTQAAAPQPPSAATPSPAPAANLAPAQAAPLGTDELTHRLHERFLADAAAEPTTVRHYLSAVSMSLADPRLELTEADLAALPLQQRRAVLAYQRAFTQLGQELGQQQAVDPQALRLAAEEILDQMRADTSLRIRNATLCTRVEGYGVYEPFRSTSFLAGVSQPVVIYAELENFTPRAESDDRFLVSLTYELALYNEADGLVVWRQPANEILDRSRNRRRDFFVVQMINLPERLTVGKYRLKMTITDRISQSIDEAAMPLEIVADPSLTNALDGGN